jgi:hypothetical protein
MMPDAGRPRLREMVGLLATVLLLATTPALYGATATPSANLTLLPLSTGAAALDGSPYGFYLVPYEGDIAAHRHRWTISIEGGGWCVGLEDCYSRSRGRTMHGKPGSLGSSLPYVGQRHGCGCMNTNGTDVTEHGCNCINLLYLDGASFSGNAAEPFPVPGRPGTFLHYRGLRNLDATLDYAFRHGLDQATELVVTGGSAGGLATFLHLDHIAERMRQSAPSCKLVTGAPVVGFFLDHPNYEHLHTSDQQEAARNRNSDRQLLEPLNCSATHTCGNFSSWMQTVVHAQNASAALMPACLAAFPGEPHLCFMSPHMVQFVQTSFFVFNSRFDAWQLDNDLQVPCAAGHAGHTSCNATEEAAIVQYGSDFLDALQPVVDSAPKNGAFITSCVCHGCPWSSVTTGTKGDAKTSWQHYADWHQAHRVQVNLSSSSAPAPASTSAPAALTTIHIDGRAPNGGGDLKDPMCVHLSSVVG